ADAMSPRVRLGAPHALLALVLAAHWAARVSGQTSVPLRTVDKGAHSNVDAARQAVARTDAEWAALWKAHADNRPAPAIDFNREMIVAVFMGSRPTAGFSIEIVEVRDGGGGLVVSYRDAMPPPGAITAQIITAPYHLAAIPKHGGEVTFTKAS